MTTKLLVIDDEPAIGRLLEYQLRDCGYDVRYEPDALIALQHLEREPPDLILLDVMMPLISGWDVCRQIRAWSNVPIIMLTAKSADLDVATGLFAGADDYVAKPFSIVQLRARIEAVLRRAGQRRKMRSEPVVEHEAPRVSEEPRQTRQPAMPVEIVAEPPLVATPAAFAAVAPTAPPTAQRIGKQLYDARVARGVALHHAERNCRVRWDFLQAMEQGNFDYIPRTQRRLVFTTYAGYLGLNHAELLSGAPANQRHASEWTRMAAWAALAVLVFVVGVVLLQAI